MVNPGGVEVWKTRAAGDVSGIDDRVPLFDVSPRQIISSIEGVVYGLLSGVTYAAIVLSLRHLREEDGAWLVMLNNLVTAVLFLPFVVHYDIWPSSEQTSCLAGSACFRWACPTCYSCAACAV